MQNKWIEKTLIISLVLVITLTFGPASYALATSTHDEKTEVLVSFKEKPGSTEKELIENAGGKIKRNYHIVPTIAASVPKGKLDSLRRDPKVTSVEEDITVQMIEDTLPWGIDRIDAETVHPQNKGRGVRVAVLDTGIDLDHPDLRVADDVSFDYAYGTTTGDDDHGHGTMVAGIIAALDNDIGVVGVAPEVELYSVKVLNRNGWGYGSDVLSGIEWAIDNNMQVINMSFGGVLNMPWAIRTALDRAYESGIVLVAGAGNMGDQDIIFSPARYESVIAVGATDQQNDRASFSCTGFTLELMTPGVSILSTSRGGGYSSGSGTSFSTPHVVGVAALLIASGVTSGFEVRQILRGTAQDLGPFGWDKWYGLGLVNADKALAATSPDATDSDNGRKDSQSNDKVPPTTSIEITGLSGNSGWYRSDVTVKLVAVDNAFGSGVAEAQYSLDGGKTWESYQKPFTVTIEGTTTVQARSRDNAGNVEGMPVSRQFKIDKTAPNVIISADPGVIWPANRKEAMVDVTVISSATDELSRLSLFRLSVKDEYGQIEPDVLPRFETQIQLEAWRDGRDIDGRVYTITITATDYAGNMSVAEARVLVLHDQGKSTDTRTPH